MHDVVIRNGEVVDGTGSPPKTADVAIDDGVITAVGENLGRPQKSRPPTKSQLLANILDAGENLGRRRKSRLLAKISTAGENLSGGENLERLGIPGGRYP